MSTRRVEASVAIRDSIDELVALAMEMQWERWPELRASLDARQVENMVQDTRYHLQFLAAALWADEPALYVDYVHWVERLFENLGLPRQWIDGSLEEVNRALGTSLEAREATEAGGMVDAAITALEGHADPIPSYIDANAGLGAVAQLYLSALLGGDRGAATRAVTEQVESGTHVRDVYTHVLTPAQLELGRLWQLNRITVAQEHYATAVTQTVMATLYPYVFAGEPGDRTLVAACVGRELHEIGVRMIADFFEMSGWNTHYLGANTPTTAIIDALVRTEADMLALSATMSYRVPEVAETIEMVRSDSRTAHVRILVGGYPFNLVEDLWKRVGADGHARDADAAIEVGEKLVPTGTG